MSEMISDEQWAFQVVTNHEEQYSIWPEHKEIPEGWMAVGSPGTKEECLDYIERVWTDMRPRSLRVEMRNSQTDPLQGIEGGEKTQDEIRSAIEETLSRHEDRVEEYADGRPELFGWFLARVLEAMEEDEANPDDVRAHLDAQLPDIYAE